ncbi:hypothetical protein [Variovorax arabinosiphilus]|uniref:hypothetical protein n=1 Tax=Variovorax arabinosiphilus TaxID=3053498 RepID=UPI00257711E3|nr:MULTISPECIES: hypothetical protein [unclassified Variovorax]MDM0118542.1 hypothetical protein [Variovorax sp. J2L1-78]MDM0128967.1 hypothetical protein [Variovorax sp. J2L1-63]MDM0233248.1 hypothetical protein [Variovorax sp. J2R1-6]
MLHRKNRAPAALRHPRLSLLVGAPLLALAFIGPALAQDGASLQAKHGALAARLADNPFKRPLVLDSAESPERLSGDIYAVVDHPFAETGALATPANWCEVLMLHLNTKHCAVKGEGQGTTIEVAVGRKFDQPLDQAQRVAFAWTRAANSADYLSVQLSANEGPLSTRDYRIVLEAVPLSQGRSFVHLAYSYAYGTAARFAMKAYLGTLGSGKVGFTVTSGQGRQGAAAPIGGVRGVVERNTMRYYLAIDAFLGAPKPEQLDRRLAAWFDATEQYARQLHETERADYLAMKKSEYRRLRQGG